MHSTTAVVDMWDSYYCHVQVTGLTGEPFRPPRISLLCRALHSLPWLHRGAQAASSPLLPHSEQGQLGWNEITLEVCIWHGGTSQKLTRQEMNSMVSYAIQFPPNLSPVPGISPMPFPTSCYDQTRGAELRTCLVLANIPFSYLIRYSPTWLGPTYVISNLFL